MGSGLKGQLNLLVYSCLCSINQSIDSKPWQLMPSRPLRAITYLGYIKSALTGSSIRNYYITKKGKYYVRCSTRHKYILLPSCAKTPSATLLTTLIAGTSSVSVSYSLRVEVRYSSNVNFSNSRSSELLSEPLLRPLLRRRIRIKRKRVLLSLLLLLLLLLPRVY